MEAPAYTTPSTGNTFWLNTTPTGFFQAELACTTNGGHLAGYLNRQEQVRCSLLRLPCPLHA